MKTSLLIHLNLETYKREIISDDVIMVKAIQTEIYTKKIKVSLSPSLSRQNETSKASEFVVRIV